MLNKRDTVSQALGFNFNRAFTTDATTAAIKVCLDN